MRSLLIFGKGNDIRPISSYFDRLAERISGFESVAQMGIELTTAAGRSPRRFMPSIGQTWQAYISPFVM